MTWTTMCGHQWGIIRLTGACRDFCSCHVTDIHVMWQLRVLARDQGSPQQTATATVTVKVQRNKYSPMFEARGYAVTIAETYTPSVTVLRVHATDADAEVNQLLI